MAFKNRIKEYKLVNANDLIPNPKNWRTHPINQRTALAGILNEVGYADAVIARETPDGLMLIDGHLRAEASRNEEVPVLILDVTEREADLILATLDPLANMAGRDEMKIEELLDGLIAEDDSVSEFLSSLTGGYDPLVGNEDWEEHWKGMPEYENEDLTYFRAIQMNFMNQEDVDRFAELIDYNITDKTKSIPFTDFVHETTNLGLQYADEHEA
tara:strand:+ start:7133 stop:7774 length:642 start_codon:yes stop_codon:yes gene_type:complete